MAGLPSRLREMAARFSPNHTDKITNPTKSPDCFLGEVTQPSESRLNETSFCGVRERERV